MAVGRANHGNLDSLVAQTGDAPGPLAFDRGPPFELQAELTKEVDCRFEVIDDDAYIVHPFERHVLNLQGVVSPARGWIRAEGEGLRTLRHLDMAYT